MSPLFSPAGDYSAQTGFRSRQHADGDLEGATREDAHQIGLTDVCRIVDNGSDAVGTVFEWTSPEFQEEFNKSDLVISKGQGNFETLTGTAKKTYFLFQSKCDVVSKELGLPPGSMLLKKS